MHDWRMIRADAEAFARALARRDPALAEPARVVAALDREWRDAQAALQEKQRRRNAIAAKAATARKAGADTTELAVEGAALREELEALENRARALEADITRRLSLLPNLLDAEVPDGTDETTNVVLALKGALRTFDFPPRQHFELGEALGLMDFEAAAKLAGSRFVVLRGALARLERALGQFMLDLHTSEHGYDEVSVPTLVNDAAVYGTAQLPKFATDLFRTTDGRWLIPTAEVPLTNLVVDKILPESALPIRVTALTDCFRSEAGAAGKDTRGMLRQHQFRKVELVSITHPEASAEEHERMTRCAEAVLEQLELPFRRVVLCVADTGFASAKTYDLEVWLPGQGVWREISSCSNCRDFQARRMNARFRPGTGGGLRFVHTLNGSGVATGRALIAIMENYQLADGTIMVPRVLQPYLGGMTRITGG